MLSKNTADCLPLANTAILMRLIQELADRGVVETPHALLRKAATDLANCPEQTARVDDAIRLINHELMQMLRPTITSPTQTVSSLFVGAAAASEINRIK